MITSLPIIVKGPVASVESKSNSADLNARGHAEKDGQMAGKTKLHFFLDCYWVNIYL